MCGICAFLGPSDFIQDEKHFCELIQKKSRIGCRGPDKTHQTQLWLSNGKLAHFSGYVLHFRGDQLVPQPAFDENGNMVLWNGEIYEGIEVQDQESDTAVLLKHLASDDREENIMSTMSRIHGPWSFIYWQANTETLWFGRDTFGRRSLLWHIPEIESDPFILSSVRILPWQFSEVPSIGIYKVCFKDSTSNSTNYCISVIPWRKTVWPGSLDVVENNEEFRHRLYPGYLGSNVTVTCEEEKTVVSHMPEISKMLPPTDDSLPSIKQDQSFTDYLENLLKTDNYLRTLSRQLTNVLLEAVRLRVFNQQKLNREKSTQVSENSLKFDGCQTANQPLAIASCNYEKEIDPVDVTCETGDTQASNASVAILFSGGIDSTLLAALADRCIPADEEIDLLNVAFEMKPKENPTNKKKRISSLPTDEKWNVPDRQTGYIALSELNPNRRWNFVEVNVTADELQHARQSCIEYLLHPLQTVLDDSIGCAVWFAARGLGVLGNGPFKGSDFISKARVILCGMGADEQLVGYSRHRVRFKEEGWEGLLNEIQLEVTRLSARNLGRDDRIITDHGKESRLPYLDENVVKFLSEIPIYQKADLNLPRGLGEKLLLRLSAYDLGLHQTSTLPKRAIQFGSRIAKMENSKEKASDICDRLVNAQNDKV